MKYKNPTLVFEGKTTMKFNFEKVKDGDMVDLIHNGRRGRVKIRIRWCLMEYKIEDLTSDFFKITKRSSEGRLLDIYLTDLAAKTCTCDSYFFRIKQNKKFKCKHIKMVGGLR